MLDRNQIIAACAAGVFVFICIFFVVSSSSNSHKTDTGGYVPKQSDILIDEIAFIKLGSYGNRKI